MDSPSPPASHSRLPFLCFWIVHSDLVQHFADDFLLHIARQVPGGNMTVLGSWFFFPWHSPRVRCRKIYHEKSPLLRHLPKEEEVPASSKAVKHSLTSHYQWWIKGMGFRKIVQDCRPPAGPAWLNCTPLWLAMTYMIQSWHQGFLVFLVAHYNNRKLQPGRIGIEASTVKCDNTLQIYSRFRMNSFQERPQLEHLALLARNYPDISNTTSFCLR